MISPQSKIYPSPLSPLQWQDIIESDSYINDLPIIKSVPAHNTSPYKTCTLTAAAPLSLDVISLFFDIVITRHADKLLRIKGLVLTTRDPSRPMIIQVVKSTITPYSWLEKWPDSPATRIIIIHTYRDNSLFIDLFNSLTDRPTIDQPDQLALSSNPLAITGMGKFKPD